MANTITWSWNEIRQEFFSLSKDFVYMNNSTFGVPFNSVRERMNEVQRLYSEGCNLDLYVEEIVKKIGQVRNMMGETVNAYSYPSKHGRSYHVGNVNSVTEGMSLVANGLSFNKGDIVLITDHEHEGGKLMWYLQRDRYKDLNISVVEVPLIVSNESGAPWEDAILERFENKLKGMNGKVKVVSFSWITCSTGHVLPARKLCRLAKRYGAISVVDAAQAFGVLPMDFQDVGCDFMVVNGHKYLNGPIGSGFICIHPRQLEKGCFWPTIVDSHNFEPDKMPTSPYQKGGVAPYINILPLFEALNFYNHLGKQVVYERLLQIGSWLRKGLSQYPEVFELLTLTESSWACVMTCFRIRGKDSEDIFNKLKTPNEKWRPIHTKHAKEGNVDAIRISPHYYNTTEELEMLADALCTIAGVNRSLWPAFCG
ncbi:MAG: aminotransferase class V-fold PLP-dependent enzyme [Candidatus Brocadia sp. AMX2]|uniref:aminotransferase class V-fold PLP-dependent enzyme n=1 Tax=Candidatus Brocadia sp. AMX2 TaxID=2293635 RepID=UPI000EC06723|nr:aminotransferase class V-fold PLP-dependent enzyme [Candidatus Brocadia sp. AMX2]MBC6933802.1 aminotransferase class V-fold PLP-dependent enzyme [Candidatus Brocadia sp.]MBL1170552.1 aminotransferase class V-fold PLP-dependent enzyme [Candidatus Brocadia sp. AMX1]NOG42078.1 aminotransferase class V-fold PLP-dependent enzyme [Planctomycetota bacterium]GIK14495.1 MAG: hypothetical protein BroJett002_32020 [Candidatus Brocadia sinica]KAA0242416.1 MAG: aminotransferase class V-fold PLP-dependen